MPLLLGRHYRRQERPPEPPQPGLLGRRAVPPRGLHHGHPAVHRPGQLLVARGPGPQDLHRRRRRHPRVQQRVLLRHQGRQALRRGLQGRQALHQQVRAERLIVYFITDFFILQVFPD